MRCTPLSLAGVKATWKGPPAIGAILSTLAGSWSLLAQGTVERWLMRHDFQNRLQVWNPWVVPHDRQRPTRRLRATSVSSTPRTLSAKYSSDHLQLGAGCPCPIFSACLQEQSITHCLCDGPGAGRRLPRPSWRLAVVRRPFPNVTRRRLVGMVACRCRNPWKSVSSSSEDDWQLPRSAI